MSEGKMERVRSLEEALAKCNELEDVVAFQIAPLSTRHGGRRSWHGVDPRDNTKWLRESGSTEELEPEMPSPREPRELLPIGLPPSSIGLWEVCFLVPSGDDLARLPMRVLIELPKRTVRDEYGTESASATQPIGGDLNTAVVSMMAQQNKFTLELLKTQGDMLATIGAEHKKLASTYREEHASMTKQLRDTELCRDQALGANSVLALQVAELKSESQLGMIVGKMAEKSPEALIDAAGRFFGGVISTLRGESA